MSTDLIYLDNAATTPLRREVKDRMIELMEGPFGNPSSTHQFGRKSKSVVEDARRFIAHSMRCTPREITFTSGGTEADNSALYLPVRDLGIKRIITSPLEHHAVLNTAKAIHQHYGIKLEFVNVLEKGEIDLDHLEDLLKDEQPTLVSLMHGNNEVGNLLDIMEVGTVIKKYGALFHSDTVQTVGHFDIHLDDLPVDFIAASAHKFYGPKGVGFMYIHKDVKVGPLIFGGAQEKGMRSGTENILNIGGMHSALQYSLEYLAEESEHILNLKKYFINRLKTEFDHVVFNGLSGEVDKSLYTVLNAGFPGFRNDSMFLFNMDINGIAVSGGSACASGSNQGSHVIRTISPQSDYPVVRFSFGKNNTIEELDRTIGVLKKMESKVVS